MSAYAIACIEHQLLRKPGFYQRPEPREIIDLADNDVMTLIGEAVEKERYLTEKGKKARYNYFDLQLQFDELRYQIESHHSNADVCGQREASLWKDWMEDGGFVELLLTENWEGVLEDAEEEWGLNVEIDPHSRSVRRGFEAERHKAFKEFLAKNEIPYDPDRGEWITADV